MMNELISKQKYNPDDKWVTLNLVNSEKDLMDLDLDICNTQGYFLNLSLKFRRQFPGALGGIFIGNKPTKEHEEILENLRKYSPRNSSGVVFFSRERDGGQRYQYFFIVYLGKNGNGKCSEYLDALLEMAKYVDTIPGASIHFISSEYDIPDDAQYHVVTVYLPKTI